MNNYELLGAEACEDGIDIIEHSFNSNRIKGLYCNGNVALNEDIETLAEKSCILAEELGHHYTTVGDIIDQSSSESRKQELRARLWAYNKRIGLDGIVRAYEQHCQNKYEIADYLDVTEDFLREALVAYRNKYGVCTEFDNYMIFFEPQLAVMKKVSD